MHLSENFTLEEFTASATAKAHGIRNIPDAAEIEAMKALCVNVLEPVRGHFGSPIRITSGFRTPQLCLAIGSSKTSQHAKGEAADFEIPGTSNLAVAAWIRDTLTFDQLILENYVRGQPNSGWVHVSYRRGRARKSVLTYMRRKYFQGLIA